jgi:hypothetical protein
MNYSSSTKQHNFANAPYNISTSHPLIPNSQQYMYYKKFISIHSEDRDTTKYPNSSEFEIELPEDYLNVASLCLIDWTFPTNYNVFSSLNNNITFRFTITNPYNPKTYDMSNNYYYRIYQATANNITYEFTIEEGNYTHIQMTYELTNKMNATVTSQIVSYFTAQNNAYPDDGWNTTLQEFTQNGGYTRFVVAYNEVTSKVWFGNCSDTFTLINEFVNPPSMCSTKHVVPDASCRGLHGSLGLPIQNSTSVLQTNAPRFYYGENGYWLPTNTDLSGSQVSCLEAETKLDLMGDSYMYMELSGQNCIDETQPYNVSRFTLTTNQTNGIVNSSFAKVRVPTHPLTQWIDKETVPYKMYNPPAERIRKLKIKIRYHNGRLVDFGPYNYSFMLEFTLMVPQILRTTNSVVYPPTQR